MQEKSVPPAQGADDSDHQSETQRKDETPPKARVVLPKPPARGGGSWPGGPGGPSKNDGRHSQTSRGKPPRLPGRNG